MTHAPTRIVGGLAALLLLGLTPATASAQDAAAGTGLAVGPASMTLDLDFRSDRATCRRVGRCGLRGEVRFRSTGTALGGGFVGTTTNGLVAGGGGFYDATAQTAARVRDRGQLCRDRIAHQVTTFGFRRNGDAVEVVFLAPAAAAGADAEGSEDPLSTRCAGPRVADLQASQALPVATTTLDALRAGPVTLTATGSHRIRSAGMRGTLRYDLAVTVTPVRLGGS